MLKQKLETQEQANEALSSETSQLLKATQETLKRTKESTDTVKKSQDKNIDKIVLDIKTLKTHLNDLSTTLADLNKRIETCIENDKTRSSQIHDLENALRAVTSALNPKASTTGVYTVKSGDSLDKIAKEQGVSVSHLKELNNLSSNTIRPGQQLKLK